MSERVPIIGHAGEAVGYADLIDGRWHAKFWQEGDDRLIDGGSWLTVEAARASVLIYCGQRMAHCLAGCAHPMPTSPDLPGFQPHRGAWDYYDCGNAQDIGSRWD